MLVTGLLELHQPYFLQAGLFLQQGNLILQCYDPNKLDDYEDTGAYGRENHSFM